MRVIAFASYPIEAAATRYRLKQFVEPLAAQGISISIKTFLDSRQFGSLYGGSILPSTGFGLLKSGIRSLLEVREAKSAEVVLVQREAMLLGPPVVEWIVARMMKKPMVLDLDDATYVPYTSPTYGRLGKTLKWFSKTDDLIRWSRMVICGNRAIAEYVSSKGSIARIIPTVVDTALFRPAERSNSQVTLGWIGTHSTFPYLKTIFPVLQDLSAHHRFKLRIVGAGIKEVQIPGIEVENVEWQLNREVRDFQSIDIGLYPIDPSLYADQWAAGKSGFKAIQYMAVGVPYVATPVGAVNEIGESGTTFFRATSNQEWFNALNQLIANPGLRKQMGEAGRRHVVKNFALPDQAKKLADALREAASRKEVG